MASRVSIPVGIKNREANGAVSDVVDDADDWLSRAASASAADTVNTRSGGQGESHPRLAAIWQWDTVRPYGGHGGDVNATYGSMAC